MATEAKTRDGHEVIGIQHFKNHGQIQGVVLMKELGIKSNITKAFKFERANASEQAEADGLPEIPKTYEAFPCMTVLWNDKTGEVITAGVDQKFALVSCPGFTFHHSSKKSPAEPKKQVRKKV